MQHDGTWVSILVQVILAAVPFRATGNSTPTKSQGFDQSMCSKQSLQTLYIIAGVSPAIREDLKHACGCLLKSPTRGKQFNKNSTATNLHASTTSLTGPRTAGTYMADPSGLKVAAASSGCLSLWGENPAWPRLGSTYQASTSMLQALPVASRISCEHRNSEMDEREDYVGQPLLGGDGWKGGGCDNCQTSCSAHSWMDGWRLITDTPDSH